jgi:hypothetical protein
MLTHPLMGCTPRARSYETSVRLRGMVKSVTTFLAYPQMTLVTLLNETSSTLYK